MPAHATPADLYRHSLRLLLDKNIPAWVGLWAEDGIIEFPFAPKGWPTRLEGKEAIAAYMRHYPDHIDLHDFPEVQIHDTTAPDRIVVELRGVGRLVETGGPFDMRYIAVVTVHDGLITSYRDYWNPTILQEPGTDFARSAR
ncbi:nuclear transport factor 2 family protein [Phytoactinopolyspora mesophila]|uniref:Nuclear transport factor 2 family protein n=1 Tax=Phytoactinopolyspora mesophila TaxID=2650750 RepID=A0A7K3LXZ0_9ACTN|nr:nuclear transport factor 2 family protein [Phytoactinopolyspora mesophila]NDL55697.1 nuclear transport factor 2 family protein [Phytoactinopolyspora mesophila]